MQDLSVIPSPHVISAMLYNSYIAKLSALYTDSMNQELPDNGGKMGMYPYIKINLAHGCPLLFRQERVWGLHGSI